MNTTTTTQTDAKTQAATEACAQALEAIEALSTLETRPVFYPREQAQARKRARRAVEALRAFTTSADEHDLLADYLDALRAKTTMAVISAKLRAALAR